MTTEGKKPGTLRRTWYLASMVHYEGNDTYSVGLLTRPSLAGHKIRWEWIEGCTWEQVQELLEKSKPGMVRTTAGGLRKAIGDANA